MSGFLRSYWLMSNCCLFFVNLWHGLIQHSCLSFRCSEVSVCYSVVTNQEKTQPVVKLMLNLSRGHSFFHSPKLRLRYCNLTWCHLCVWWLILLIKATFIILTITFYSFFFIFGQFVVRNETVRKWRMPQTFSRFIKWFRQKKIMFGEQMFPSAIPKERKK